MRNFPYFNTRALCVFLTTFSGILMLANASADSIQVFTDSTHRLTNTGNTPVIWLDAASQLEKQLSAGLPANPTNAQALAQQRLQQDGKGMQQKLATAYQGITDAWQLGVAKLPAVVVDNRYVVYGESDVALALAKIEHYQKAHP